MPDPLCKEKPQLALDLRKKVPRTTLRYWLQNNLKMEWAFKPEFQGRMSHRLSWFEDHLDPALQPQVPAHRVIVKGGDRYRVGQLYRTYRTLNQLMANLRIGLYGGKGTCE
jgi:hypothetical protein